MRTKNILTITLIGVLSFLAIPLMAQEIDKTEITKSINNEVLHSKIVRIIAETNIIEEKCDNILISVENNDLQSLATNLANINVEEFYSERHCMDIIPALLEQTKEGKNMIQATQLFINKFGHPDNLIVSYMLFGGSFHQMTLLANWATSEYLAKNKNTTKTLIDFAEFLIEKGANINEEFEEIPGEKTTIKDFIYEYGTDDAIKLIKKVEKQQQKK